MQKTFKFRAYLRETLNEAWSKYRLDFLSRNVNVNGFDYKTYRSFVTFEGGSLCNKNIHYWVHKSDRVVNKNTWRNGRCFERGCRSTGNHNNKSQSQNEKALNSNYTFTSGTANRSNANSRLASQPPVCTATLRDRFSSHIAN